MAYPDRMPSEMNVRILPLTVMRALTDTRLVFLIIISIKLRPVISGSG